MPPLQGWKPSLINIKIGITTIFIAHDADCRTKLDTRAHAQAAYPEGKISVDGFLYVRAAVVAGGRDRFQKVLADPTQMPSDEDFEPLLSLAGRAYEKKTGASFDYFPPVNYETFSNRGGWE